MLGITDAAYLGDKFASGAPYDQYVSRGTAQQKSRWEPVFRAASLNGTQRELIKGFARKMKVLVISCIWCGDCAQQCPLLARIAEGNPSRIELRFLERDEHKDLAMMMEMNGGDRVPAVLFLAEDFQFCAFYGDRSIHRYRAMAKAQLGPACPTGIVAPEADELSATLQDWLIEFERIQLMLRLSPRLRARHGD